MNISGTRSSHLLDSYEYWEVQSSFSIEHVQWKERVACTFGICNDCHGDVDNMLLRNPSAYVCGVERTGKRSAGLVFASEGCILSDVRPLTWKTPININLGFFLNLYKRELSIIDVERQSLLSTFKNLKQCDYSAVFSTCSNYRLNLKVNLFSGSHIQTVPSIVYRQLL